jgi:hypothetical protein
MDIRLLIDGFMAAEKTLSSAVGSWVPDRAGEIVRFVRTVEVNGEQPGIQLEVKAYPREEALKFRILLARIIHDPLRLVDFPPPFSAEANS